MEQEFDQPNNDSHSALLQQANEKILTKEDAESIYLLEENSLGPTESFSQEEHDDFISEVVGKTALEYCKLRNPDDYFAEFIRIREVISV